MRESDEKFAAAFDSAPVLIAISDLETDAYLDVNQQFTALSGFTRAEAIGRTPVELGWLDRVDRARLRALMRREDSVRDHELVLHAKGGGDVICRYWGNRITVSGRQCLLSVGLDITDRRSIEQQLRQAQKMEAIGTLAGGIAHDFNNLLTVILGNCEMIGRASPPEEPVGRQIGLIREAGERASSLVQQLLAFGRKQVLRPTLVDLAELVADGVRMLERLLGEDIEIRVVPSAGTGQVRADPGQLQQILLNLALNARDAMPSGGKLTIETGRVRCSEADVARQPGLKPGPYVVLTVSDTGHGMDAPTQARIFEPFFTTKEFGRGSGLGLATVHGIVSQSGGHIEVVSRVGHGTTFRLYFPAARHGAERAAVPPPERETPRGTETVLVTEDAPDVRDLACRILRELGYRVLEASGGEEALRVAAGEQRAVHLLLTDVVMPGMSGRVLADRLAAQRPELKVLYMSGYTGDVLAYHAISDRELRFIQKPFRPNDLALKVRQVLDEPQATA
ncbi:MAG: response regulator [Deltaproteobacteria bacterium]|nr:response regulator [Deltaproteobacteria bacterium]